MEMGWLGRFFNQTTLCMTVSLASLSLQAQTFSDRLTGYYAEVTVFSEATHTRTDLGNRTVSDDELSLGIAGTLGADLQSGSNSLSALYNASLETSQTDDFSENNDNSSITGVSNYFYRDPVGRLDFNAGHTIRSVRNDSGFVVDPNSYDTQNAISAGAGVQFYPGDVSTLRLSSQAARTFEEGDRKDTDSLTAAAELSRRLSNQSAGSLTARRTWANEENDDTTMDSALLGYIRELESGVLSIGAGASRADVDYANGDSNDSDAAIGYLSRSWTSSEAVTEIRYDRALTSTALDLAIDFPEVDEFSEESVRINELGIEDTIELRHITTQVCYACDLAFRISGTIRESQRTGETTHEFDSNLNLGVQVTSLQRLLFSYSWSADADQKADVFTNQVHRFEVGVRRLLAEQTFVTVEGRYSFTESRLDQNDRDQFAVRLSLTHGMGITNR